MGKRSSSGRAELAMFVSLVRWLRRAGVPLWGIVPIGGVLLALVLFRPAIEQRLGLRLPLPGGASPTASTPDHEEAKNAPVGDRQASRSSSADGAGKADRGSGGDPKSSGLTDFFEEVRADVFESPAGLRYRRGSVQGHRLKHVMAHASDQPKRAGPHGVFDADEPAEVFALIDEAYEQAESGVDTRTKREQDRTIHTIDLGRRIGFVGGQVGNARGRPAARRMRLVLEGVNVITAYPVK